MIAPLASQAGATPPDSLRRALNEVFARPEYRWEDSRVVLRWLVSVWLRLADWMDAYQRSHPTQYLVLLTVLVVILVAILVHFGYIAWRITRPTLRTRPVRSAAGPVVDDVRARLDRAAELAAAGRYAEALAQRFLALVLQLETRQVVRFHPAKTPAEYVAEARLDPEGRGDLGALVARLYRHLFGGLPCSARDYDEFGMMVEGVREHVAPR